MTDPVSADVGASFGKFFFKGEGPSHSILTNAIQEAGYADADPYDPVTMTPSKVQRLTTVFRAAQRRPAGAKRLVDALLSALRVEDYFTEVHPKHSPELTAKLKRALAAQGWDLSENGYLTRLGDIDLDTGGREALDEQLNRIKRNVEDPAALLGAAKDLLESISKFALEETHMLPDRKMDYPEVLHLAMEQLGFVPRTVDATIDGGKAVRAVYQSPKQSHCRLTSFETRKEPGTAGHCRLVSPPKRPAL